MRLSTVILPIHRWSEGQKIWRRAEELGFHAAYTYDHLSWRSFRDEPWFGAVPTLTAAAAVTERIRIGTMVTSPNFRHPVTLAKDLMSVDDVSDGRLTVGVGAGGTGFDATALGQEAWTPRERADRFGEFVPLLDRLLTDEVTTAEGRFYSAHEARMVPGCVQRPRVPLYVAATGPRGLRLAAEHGQGWISYGDPRGAGDVPADRCPAVIAEQVGRLADACAAAGRDPGDLEKVLLQGSTQERPLDSLEAFVDYAGRYREIGVTEIVVHWPVPGSVFDTDPAVFEEIAAEGLARLG
ncbi:LLM class flavin-dependent oxidoreductase [Streptacidiphilus sp. ASG 303]|uniref:LLM class flavin-dependent oxidoreductase n=1 Tax=Streptacidiphilus sp. ASG 303 TaxID=2896847 RepID=UPI001E51C0D4|nr:LLM class flavin-dependent oxidoreductase [Streptacidiphilus sp. ASG 303]MCD0482282.1 LLM class flavin-dependent oxidoreductase [Streptacidiphilus sp. ASG 303]